MSLLRDTLARYLETYLACQDFQDYAPNGIQIEGKSAIGRICTAVTASEDVIQRAITWGADALLVHHGYFWRGESPVITGAKKRRIAALLKHQMTLYAYHLPLDCHIELGNNACLGKALGMHNMRAHTASKMTNLLWAGDLKQAISPTVFIDQLSNTLQRTPLHVAGSTKHIKQVAWCTGAAQDLIEEASSLGVDAYLSGEISERTYHQALELGIHYFACGHHATERYGIRALGEHLAHHFQLEQCFIDSENPV